MSRACAWLLTSLVALACAPAVSNASTASLSQKDEAPVRWACKPKDRTVQRRVGKVEIFSRPTKSIGLFACLSGQPYAFDMPASLTPPYLGFGGPPLVQVAGGYLVFILYNYCGRDPRPCGTPFGVKVDLRNSTSVEEAPKWRATVKMRVNAHGSLAASVREDPDYLPEYPPGPGPFRIDVADVHGRHTVDQGPGIDPLSLAMVGTRVTWTHDGQLRSYTVTDRPRRYVPARR